MSENEDSVEPQRADKRGPVSERLLNDLDRAARANVPERLLSEYLRYKCELVERGESEDTIREVLTGWIWDASEPQPDDDRSTVPGEA